MGREFSEIAAGGQRVPLYLLQFDKRGAPTSTATRAALIDAVRARDYRDVYVFAHGWNNGFDDSLQLFQRFFTGFLAARTPDPDWKPVFIGIQWPSIVAVFPWEKGPQLAGVDADAEFQKNAIAQLADELGSDQARRFIALAVKQSLTQAEQRELAELARAALDNVALGEIGESAVATDDLMSGWRALQSSDAEPVDGDFGFADDTAAGPQAAGLEVLDPRNLIRTATVYTMKDRAGVIGSIALRGLLEELTASGASVRLIGHSYGARVVLAALSTATLAAKVRSALLLQPAVNQFCFADAGRIPKSQNAGGFRKALDQLELPLYTTFSAKDFPLHDTFHLALRRAKDLGEAEIAAGAAPSVYCALGGYGPSGLADGGVVRTQIEDTGSYAIAQGARILALDGTQGRINGHGDVTNPCTWWALIDQDQRATQARGHNP